MHVIELDRYDRALLEALQAEGRLSSVELAEKVRLSASQCNRRQRKLESLGVIRGYAALLERRRLGLQVMAFVSVSLEQHGSETGDAFARAIADYAWVLECWAVSGDSDYLLRVVSPDLEAFSEFLLHQLLSLPMVRGVRSNILLQELKSTVALPLG
ncbi:MAG: Lrp/AsnC family transcriptional regulator [Ectothiorhodospiraceae bacterium]|nr:Lrp/AsnC family transcriptional regulator [Ectothiorhodospiraceae bacterium]MCH8504575.1 Lrp/AsnC family transcriptional regulator [Ectothiorhodospiraceae bacterium]